MWTCQLCIREDRMQVKKQKDTLFWIHVYINLTNVQELSSIIPLLQLLTRKWILGEISVTCKWILGHPQ